MGGRDSRSVSSLTLERTLNRVLLAFRYFFDVLTHGKPSDAVINATGPDTQLVDKQPADDSAPATDRLATKPSDGALQILSILQRDSRLLDFLMEDVSSYSDTQIGAAARVLHDQCRDSVSHYVSLQPVIDGVEGAFTRVPAANPELVRFIGNVPAQTPSGGVLRHKGWRAASVELPPLTPATDVSVLAPAEIEVE